MKLPNNPLSPLSRADGEIVFDETWQAQALGLADCLVHAGVISASQWSEALGKTLRNATRAQAPDNIDTYYNAVIAALEILLQKSGTVVAHEVAARKTQWEQAYLNTPHGQPVELSANEE